MLKEQEIVKMKIDSLVYEGAGIGRVNNFAVFVENSAPGDVLNVRITSVKKSFARGEIVEIVEPSPMRVEPQCDKIKICGGCNWQHIDYAEQLRAKKELIEYNVRRIGNMEIPVRDVIASDKIFNYRCKVQYHTQKRNGETLIGYYQKGSHDVVNIDTCAIQPKIVDEISNFLREKISELNISTYNHKNKKGLLKHTVFLYSSSEENLLLIFVINAQKVPKELRELSKLCREKFGNIIGTLANFNTKYENFILDRKTVLIDGRDYIEEKLENKTYRITAGSFFQINPSSAIKMFNTVKSIISERLNNPTVLDVYAGVASFAIWLKDIAKEITAIEECSQAIKDARVNLELNKSIAGADIEIIEGNADKVLKKLVEENKSYEALILDPPRIGCSKIALDSAAKLAEKYIVYVSCNPATLVRDLKILKELGFEAEYIQPLDMFCHTYHIESIVVLKRV